ncbi:MAG TPA: 23S rRNA (pseudouridine(1915)-N(3))-methyltransferase RlmH, partial [Methanoregulaceae archaeon]|nr:23S rRNA (pseudouridine(1915)-N(3))-methyltransferase RlmH [Methanoregulaceae archaeon]
MQIQIVAIGKIRESFIRGGISVYQTRLCSANKITFTDLPEERIPSNSSDAEKRLAKEREGRRLLAAATDTHILVALDQGGTMLSSRELSDLLTEWELKGRGK